MMTCRSVSVFSSLALMVATACPTTTSQTRPQDANTPDASLCGRFDVSVIEVEPKISKEEIATLTCSINRWVSLIDQSCGPIAEEVKFFVYVMDFGWSKTIGPLQRGIPDLPDCAHDASREAPLEGVESGSRVAVRALRVK